MATCSNFEAAKQRLLGRKKVNKTCTNCQCTFKEARDLVRHENKRKDIRCLHCDRQFCNDEHFQKHLRSINNKGGNIIDYEMPINTKSGYEDADEFHDILTEKKSEINDSENIYSLYKVYNRKIDPDFTYGDF